MKVFLVAGGTAGHINGAIALGEVLKREHYKVKFISSQRKIDYRVLSDYREESWHFNSKALKGRGKLQTLKNIFFNAIVFFQVFFKTVFNRPKFAIGFGGFICGPSLLACKALGVPYYIVEQNSVMGMANKLLVPFSHRVFSHFKKTINFPTKYQDKIIVSGNPIRSSICYAIPRFVSDEIRILVFGGSLGAEEINEVIKSFIQDYKKIDIKIRIKHQVGHGKTIKIPLRDNVSYEQLDYIDDMNAAYKWSDAIVCRGGASTISELAIIQKPCLIFPYPHIDQHQLHNAKMLEAQSQFLVNYIERKDEVLEKVEKLNHFLNLVLTQSSKPTEKITQNSAQLIYENIHRDFL